MADTVFLGIDLGTSRTSITSSTGFRKTVYSYVGYPKDYVARKKLGGRDVIYGQEALDNRMSLNLYRPLAGSVIKQNDASDSEEAKKAIKDLLEYVVRARSPSPSPTGWIFSMTLLSWTSAPAPRTCVGSTAWCPRPRTSGRTRWPATRSTRCSPT